MWTVLTRYDLEVERFAPLPLLAALCPTNIPCTGLRDSPRRVRSPQCTTATRDGASAPRRGQPSTPLPLSFRTQALRIAVCSSAPEPRCGGLPCEWPAPPLRLPCFPQCILSPSLERRRCRCRQHDHDSGVAVPVSRVQGGPAGARRTLDTGQDVRNSNPEKAAKSAASRPGTEKKSKKLTAAGSM